MSQNTVFTFSGGNANRVVHGGGVLQEACGRRAEGPLRWLGYVVAGDGGATVASP